MRHVTLAHDDVVDDFAAIVSGVCLDGVQVCRSPTSAAWRLRAADVPRRHLCRELRLQKRILIGLVHSWAFWTASRSAEWGEVRSDLNSAC